MIIDCIEIISEAQKNTEMLTKDINRINKIKIKAIGELLLKPRIFLDFGGSNPVLIETIYKKKLLQIMEADNAEDIKLILAHPKVRFNGCEIVADNKWVLPEEELIAWSNTSLKAPLSQEGVDRYMKLFKEVFPEQADSIGI